MKKFLLFVLFGCFCALSAGGAVRDENAISRGKNTAVTSTNKTRSVTSRNPIKTTVSSRTAKPVTILIPKNNNTRSATRTPVRNTNNIRNVTARAASSTDTTISAKETRTGAEYEQCKTALFTCMDQFCQLKDDNYRRCSCSDRVYDFQDISDTYQKVNEKLTEFSENLDVVGMTREQVTAMKTSSAGEDALTEDKSASKQLLQAIMNSIRGEDSSVGGKYKDLNTINLSIDMSNAFGMDDSGQIIASYNGTTLYKAVFPKCKNAVKKDCNNASMQRAINAYLMAIEQDCNTVESALKNKQKTLKASTHQSSAMLDLARVENRQKHNADNISECLINVESSVQSEQVCGANYHKCLDNGQFIDVTTGAPLTGVSDFYKLGEILTFKSDTDLKDQKLSTIPSNRTFVQFFENKTKKFAQEALDKCTENADFVWQQYLDRALLDIYYAQRAKVKDIKQSCIDLVANCYDNQNTSITNAMMNLTGNSSILLKPNTITLTKQMCSDYISSCNNMFGENIIQTYINTKDDTDNTNACRAIAQQCFSEFGGTEYGGFYYTQSGLFQSGRALDWFTLYDDPTAEDKTIVSPCAQQIVNTAGCEGLLETVFGGFDNDSNSDYAVANRTPRPKGIATEIYYQIIDNLSAQCAGLGGYFVEYKYAKQYGYNPNNLCRIDSDNADSIFYINSTYNSDKTLVYWYHFMPSENMCPLNYDINVDTQSWGICSCWENGGYRSKNGTIPTCRPLLPSISGDNDPICSVDTLCSASTSSTEICAQPRFSENVQYWCQQSVMSKLGQICPTTNVTSDNLCADNNNQKISTVESDVPKRIRQ